MILLSRRRMIFGTAGLLATGIGGCLLGIDLAGTKAYAGPPLAAAVAPPAAFISLSQRLTGVIDLDPSLAQALYSGLHHAGLDPQIETLSALLNANPDLIGDPLQRLLAQQPAPLGQLYQQMLSGWYLGLVGQPGTQRCIGFENIISYTVVKDSLLPPSYAPGAPNFWVHPPAIGGGLHG